MASPFLLGKEWSTPIFHHPSVFFTLSISLSSFWCNQKGQQERDRMVGWLVAVKFAFQRLLLPSWKRGREIGRGQVGRYIHNNRFPANDDDDDDNGNQQKLGFLYRRQRRQLQLTNWAGGRWNWKVCCCCCHCCGETRRSRVKIQIVVVV